LAAAFAVLVASAGAWAQTDLPVAPSAVLTLRGPGGVVVERASAGAMPLGLDEAIDLGLKHNLQVELDRQNMRSIQGQTGQVINALLPSLSAQVKSGAQEINLAAQGFKPSSLAKFGFAPGTIPLIVKVNTTSAQLNVNQQLFNAPAYEVYRAAQAQAQVANLQMLLSRGNVVLATGTEYLRVLADAAEITNAQALLKQDEESLRQATARDEAGVGTRVDVLRAKVAMQTQQQAVIAAEDTFAKDKIALNREMGLPAEQELKLSDTVPYAELAELPLEQAKTLAYQRRKDYTGLLAQLNVDERERKAARYEYLPTVAFGGYYGVLGETTGLYHGVFSAAGSVKFPIFREATFRGEREVADASLGRVRNQIEDLKVTIEQQIRASMLDVEASAALVKVARSNVELSQQELSDASDRFAAGVDDNLRVIEAQAVVAQAQTTLVEDVFGYNQAKLALARNTGVVETQYKSYLGR
jgi:outer membrane protein TolC